MKRLNVERLSEERLREAERELEVAEAFLADDLLRNAAGKPDASPRFNRRGTSFRNRLIRRRGYVR